MDVFLVNQKCGGTTMRSNAYRMLVYRERAPIAQQPITISYKKICPSALQKCAWLTKIPKIYSACSDITTIRMAIFGIVYLKIYLFI